MPFTAVLGTADARPANVVLAYLPPSAGEEWQDPPWGVWDVAPAGRDWDDVPTGRRWDNAGDTGRDWKP